MIQLIRDNGFKVKKSVWLMRVYMLFFLQTIWAQQTSARIDISRLITPDKIEETFIYWNKDLLVIVPDSLNGQKVIRAFHTPLNPNIMNHEYYDNDVLEYTTLKPLLKHTAKGSIYYTYPEKGKVVCTYVNHNSKERKVIEFKNVPQKIFNRRGPGAGVLVACLNLKKGLKTDFLTLDTDFPYREDYTTTLLEYSLAVIGEEAIQLNTKTYDTYVVEINSKIKNKGFYSKYWVTKESPHMALKIIYVAKNSDRYKSKRFKPFTIRKIIRKR